MALKFVALPKGVDDEDVGCDNEPNCQLSPSSRNAHSKVDLLRSDACSFLDTLLTGQLPIPLEVSSLDKAPSKVNTNLSLYAHD